MGQPHELAQAPLDNEIASFPIFVARAKYDFAVDGGAISTINLMPSTELPSGALILGAYINVITPPTSAGAATIGIGSEAASDLQSAIAISGAPWSTTGVKAASTSLGTDPVKLTAARNITATIGTATLTAGVFEVVVLYFGTGLV
jgi:hypothetical protein